MQFSIDRYWAAMSEAWKMSISQIEGYYADLSSCQEFLDAINESIQGVPEFAGTHFSHVDDFRVFRCMLYLLTRAYQPETFVETGVLNGFGSAFILLAMRHNQKGRLYSIDLPPIDPRIISQGTTPLPKGKQPGWAIPDMVRDRHQLELGAAEVVLPRLLAEKGAIDVFLHDSDHCYTHMMFELSLAWRYLRPGGWVVCDNVEQNHAFFDFARGVGARELVLASFDTAERVWKHGLLQKAEEEAHA